jgi:hypothetical protein
MSILFSKRNNFYFPFSFTPPFLFMPHCVSGLSRQTDERFRNGYAMDPDLSADEQAPASLPVNSI